MLLYKKLIIFFSFIISALSYCTEFEFSFNEKVIIVKPVSERLFTLIHSIYLSQGVRDEVRDILFFTSDDSMFARANIDNDNGLNISGGKLSLYLKESNDKCIVLSPLLSYFVEKTELQNNSIRSPLYGVFELIRLARYSTISDQDLLDQNQVRMRRSLTQKFAVTHLGINYLYDIVRADENELSAFDMNGVRELAAEELIRRRGNPKEKLLVILNR